MLSELHTALADVSFDIPTPSVSTSTSGGGTSSSSSSGGGGGGGGDTKGTLIRYAYEDRNNTQHLKYPVYTTGHKKSEGVLETHDKDKKVSTGATDTCYCSKCGHYMGIYYKETTTPSSTTNRGGGAVRDVTSTLIGMQPTRNLVAFDTGGTISGEGIAYVHDKERVLTGPQNELFERLVQSLDMMNRISVGSMPMFGQNEFSGNNGVSVGDIIVNVDRMETDADYEQMAERVLEAIMEKLNRGSAVGGIRFSR